MTMARSRDTTTLPTHFAVVATGERGKRLAEPPTGVEVDDNDSHGRAAQPPDNGRHPDGIPRYF